MEEAQFYSLCLTAFNKWPLLLLLTAVREIGHGVLRILQPGKYWWILSLRHSKEKKEKKNIYIAKFILFKKKLFFLKTLPVLITSFSQMITVCFSFYK